jgi:hypothetical protein
MTEILGEDPRVPARQDGHRTRTDAAKLREARGIFKNVDRLELNPTDREKLFEFQATRSARLPERFQLKGICHDPLLIRGKE